MAKLKAVQTPSRKAQECYQHITQMEREISNHMDEIPHASLSEDSAYDLQQVIYKLEHATELLQKVRIRETRSGAPSPEPTPGGRDADNGKPNETQFQIHDLLTDARISVSEAESLRCICAGALLDRDNDREQEVAEILDSLSYKALTTAREAIDRAKQMLDEVLVLAGDAQGVGEAGGGNA